MRGPWSSLGPNGETFIPTALAMTTTQPHSQSDAPKMGRQLPAWRAGRLIGTPYGIQRRRLRLPGGFVLSGHDPPRPGFPPFFVPAILVASVIGGKGPGILATILGLFLGVYFVAGSPADVARRQYRLPSLSLASAWAPHGARLLRRSRRAAAANAEEALAREAHVKSILDTIS